MEYLSLYSNILRSFDELYAKCNDEKGHYLFLDEGIFAIDDKRSDSRYPYVKDGMTLWAHQNGKIHLNESDFFILPETTEGENSYLSIFLGIKGNDKYIPTSLFEYDRYLNEDDVKRACLFSTDSATYFLKKDNLMFALTMLLNDKKKYILRGVVKNVGNRKEDIYTSLFFNPMLMHSNYTTVETKWFKSSVYEDGCFHFHTTESLSRTEHLKHDYYLNRLIDKTEGVDNTTSRLIYSNSKTLRPTSSECLLTGSFKENKTSTGFGDLAIAGDFIKKSLLPNEELNLLYILTKEKELNINFDEADSLIKESLVRNKEFDIFDFKGSDLIDTEKLTSFSSMLVKQVDYCARTKNSTLLMLGFRDIFQALEAMIIFNPTYVRKKIIDCLEYESVTGRCPRQFAWSKDGEVRIDSREFIDLGLWVIDCVYQYLSYTHDFSLLDEKLRYIEIRDDGSAFFSKKVDSLYEHLKTLMSYLVNNIDKDTDCLKTLYGDWNDAINGLGNSETGIGFGNGVSIMATFQLYSSVNKMMDISSHYQKDDENYLTWLKKNLEIVDTGLKNNAFVKKGDAYHILHGWANNKKFFVGSFDDIDHVSRDTLTSNAFYVISHYSDKHPEYKDSVIEAYHRLEGKYGFKTFYPEFNGDSVDVGRIVYLPKGCAENAATYIHGAVFAIYSLFMLNKPTWAWSEIMKVIPITHDFISTTPFVMPNSYVENEELGVDGESMNDWFTGSSSTLLKTLIRNAFGFDPNLDEMVIHPKKMPFEDAKANFVYLGKEIELEIKDEEGVYVNGKYYRLENGEIRIK